MRLLHGLCLAILGCTLVSVSVAQAGQMSLKHKNVECAVCHGTDKPTKLAPQDGCIKCHGKYKGKVIPNVDYNPDRNPRRPIVEVNPHDSHLGNVRCTLCHREHSASPKTTCNQCHANFRLNAK